MRETRCSVAGRPVKLWRGGSGPPLLLLQGGVADAALHWSTIWEALATRFAVLAPDWPGFGESAPLPRSRFADMLDWIDALCVATGADDLLVVGNSMGGTLARLYAAARPKCVRGAALLNGGGFVSLRPTQRLLLASPLGAWITRRNAARGLAPALLDRMFARPDRLDPALCAALLRDGTVHRLMRDMLTGPQPSARTPGQPTLVLWGAEDRWVPIARGEAIAAEISGARFVRVEGAGHLPQLEQPGAVLDALFSFAAACRVPAGAASAGPAPASRSESSRIPSGTASARGDA